MKRLLYISLIIFLACEEVVIVDLPPAQNLIVVEGWLTDSVGRHPIRITRSNGFSDMNPAQPIENAQVAVQARSGGSTQQYSYSSNGYYEADVDYQGAVGVEYRVLILIDTIEIRSDWDEMPEGVPIGNLQVDSFEENDPNNSNQQITIFYPKIRASDPSDRDNFYRWIFYKNGEIFNVPDPITIQNDRFFNGNLIPNNFQNFDYASGDEMSVQLLSISDNSFNYLSLLRSQITTLGTSSGTTPAVVTGNLYFTHEPTKQVLGYFGTASLSDQSVTVP